MQSQNLPPEELKKIANRIRIAIITMLLEAKSGHPGGALGMTDVFTALYFAVLSHDPQKPLWEHRDRVLLSNGHICPVLYATLAQAGYFPKEELQTLRKLGSRLQGHPHSRSLPGVENTSGPLGQGLSQAIGVATALKMKQSNSRVYCLLSDGEQQEGQTWEAYLYAGAHKLNNLTVLIDRNNIQIDGYTEDILPLKPLGEKIAAFGFKVIEIDGHSFEQIIDACNQAAATPNQPTAIICATVPGKGVPFMENLPKWHGTPPSATEAQEAIEALTKLEQQL